jgi:signal transduction histidine kinase
MSIRKKITLWISVSVILFTLFFSTFVFFEMLEQSFLLVDKELDHMARALVEEMEKTYRKKGEYDVSQMTFSPDNYWIKVTSRDGKPLYQSRITHFTDILPNRKNTYMVEKTIPRDQIWLEQDEHDEVFFRVKIIEARLGNSPIMVHIAKPIEKIEEDVEELLLFFAISLGFCTLIIIFVSYKLAGKIIAPVSAITKLSMEISEKSLDKRIPLGKTRDELYHLSSSLNKMFDRLQFSFLRQKEFIGNASHELKSPITRLLLFQEDMLMNQEHSPAAQTLLMKQLDTTRRMSQLVKQLLDLSRLEHQETLNREQVDLAALMNQVLDDYGELFSAKNIQLDCKMDEPLRFSGDSEKLFRLFINLIDNSIRYNLEERGCVSVKGWKKNENIVLEVSNTGPGIPEKDINRIFEQFYRVEKSRAIVHGGSGLGLAIAKKIVQLHEGTIQSCNTSDQRVKITVLFPVSS